MLSKIKKACQRIRELMGEPRKILISVDRIDRRLNLPTNLSPIEQHLILSAVYNTGGLFHRSYVDWRIKRINKILEIYGIEFFKNKNILEVGGGHADIGAFLAELGAKVLCLDGRMQNVNYAKLKHRNIMNLRCLQFNLENDFSEFGKFDLIINFGLLYHLKNVDKHLGYCFKNSNDVLLETVVCDSTDPHKIFLCDEKKEINEEALEGIGSRPSPFYVERIAAENGFEIVRHFSKDLNSETHGTQFSYDWEHKNDDRLGDEWKLRRFWRFKKTAHESRQAGLQP
jgi:hypothetical protein